MLMSIVFLIYTTYDIIAEDMQKKMQEQFEKKHSAIEITSVRVKKKKYIVSISENSVHMGLAIEKPEKTPDKYAISDTEAQMLMKLAMAEAEGEGVGGKALVMLIVFNRVSNEGFPDSIEKVIFQETYLEKQFSTVEDGGRYWESVPDDECMEALELIQSGWDKSKGALYFESCDKDSWQSQSCEYLFRYGSHKFYRYGIGVMKWLKKNMLIIALGLILTAIAMKRAYIERGYLSYGGEYLILPLLLMLKKFFSDIKEVFTGVR